MRITFHLIYLLLFLLLIPSACNSQTPTSLNSQNFRLVGGPCEGCDAVLEYGNKKLTSVDTLPGFKEESEKIKVMGTVYKSDGKTPAPNVILYVHHTNTQGFYPKRGNEKGWAKSHGYIRGWVKTDSNGHYEIYTFKPAAYPNRSEPAHIHFTVLEPNGDYYWIESCHFKGDPLLTRQQTDPDAPRGGTSGLLILKEEDGLGVGIRDIILGKNIPGYE
jgi:protocatechuate 3,4-dioxygenase beta subunit